jgi:hypothetical protein
VMRDSRLHLVALLVASCGAVALASHVADASGRLYFLDIRGGRVVSAALDGSDLKVLLSGRTGIPDGSWSVRAATSTGQSCARPRRGIIGGSIWTAGPHDRVPAVELYANN